MNIHLTGEEANPGVVEFKDVSCPDPGPRDLVIDVTHSWISNGTEGSFLRGERLAGDTARKPGDPSPFPMVAGYQKVGRVRSVGADVRGFAAGDFVFASMSRVEGMFDNEFAGHVSPSVCRTSFVHRLPEEAEREPEGYCGLVLAQVGFNCGSRPRMRPGALAVVVGDGLVGQWTAQTLLDRGARVVMTGRRADRLAHFRRDAESVGAADRAHALRAMGTGAEEVAALEAGSIAVLVDTVGDARLFDAFLPQMEHGGSIVAAGFYGLDGWIEIQRYRYREIAFDLVAGATRERLDETIERIRTGRLRTTSLITHRYPVERAAEAWASIEGRAEPTLGVVLECIRGGDR
jgi:2-desacetyl-2-hydroxyethyl bacteriochlorophyllide A dehydrogenase